MRRAILSILFFASSIFTAKAQSQLFMNFRTGFFNQHDAYQEEHYFRKEVRELNQFRKKVDRFIIAGNKEEWAKADFIRSSVVRDMKDEIHQTEKKIRFLKKTYQKQNRGRGEIYSKRDTQQQSYKSNRYDKRYDNRGYDFGYRQELIILEKRLDFQIQLMHEILRTRIGYGVSAWRSVKHIERSMLQFEDLMREEIRYLRADYRDKDWRDHPRNNRFKNRR